MDLTKTKQLEAFLIKETPTYGGCMVCETNNDGRHEFLLVERHKFANGDGFTINMRMFYDYDFLWDENNPWKILWKYGGGDFLDGDFLDEEEIKKSRKQDVEDFIEWEKEMKRDRRNGAGTD